MTERSRPVHQSRHIGKKVLHMGIKFSAGLIDHRLPGFLSPPIADHRLHAMTLQIVMNIRRDFPGTALIINTVDLKYFHL